MDPALQAEVVDELAELCQGRYQGSSAALFDALGPGSDGTLTQEGMREGLRKVGYLTEDKLRGMSPEALVAVMLSWFDCKGSITRAEFRKLEERQDQVRGCSHHRDRLLLSGS